MRADNTEAVDALFRAHYERIGRVIGRVIHDQPRAEELAVEVFLKWWQNSATEASLNEGWLYRTAVRKALDELRSQTRRNRFERLAGVLRGSPPTPEQIYAATVEQRRTRTVLAALGRRHAELLLLRSQDFSYRKAPNLSR